MAVVISTVSPDRTTFGTRSAASVYGRSQPTAAALQAIPLEQLLRRQGIGVAMTRFALVFLVHPTLALVTLTRTAVDRVDRYQRNKRHGRQHTTECIYYHCVITKRQSVQR